MKKVMKLAYLLMGVALLLSSCSEDIFPGGSESNEDVTISLAYSDVSPRDIVVNSRATDAEERHLDNLYIYIFDGNGNLKGYKGIEDASQLEQTTSDSKKATISGIKTRTGDAYIYAVANIATGLYPVSTSNRTVEEGKLPINLDESQAQAGGYDFTLNDLKALSFNRNNRNTIQISSAFLMSGAVQNGNMVSINSNGDISSGDNSIRLSRIVSKVKFTIEAKKDKGVTRSFKLANYDIMNIAMDGSLVGKIDGNSRVKTQSVSDIAGFTRGVNDVENDAEFFEVYLPENLQDAKATATSQEMREDDGQSTTKVFTNAPAYGTYVVLKGKYEETKGENTQSADVTYYVHLGDCSRDVNNYDVERNCKYTFKITVAGVNKIIVEAQKTGNDQPGAEGIVLEYGNMGKNLTLDSHYEYMVMRFYQNNIQELKKAGKGYFYQVYALGNHTDVINVGETTVGNKNNVDTSWIQFAIKCSRDGSSSKYSTDKTSRGTACSYPGTTYKKDLYDVEEFLKYLYENAESTSIWTGSDSKGKYVDATCFISENYYKDRTWNQYVNDVDKRAFYVANEVETSKDGRSVYAKTQYGLTQYNIQTFYNRNLAENITAYGCETINDEDGKSFTVVGNKEYTQYNWNRNKDKFEDNSKGDSDWNGRANLLQNITLGNATYGWDSKSIKETKSLVKSCMSRNRDLNGDGIINADEVRWYAPTTKQMVGLWIGEEVISTESKLYQKSTSDLTDKNNRMLYYTSNHGTNTFFSEEGMATNNNHTLYPPTLVRCVRNLKSNGEGYAEVPDEYFTYNSTKMLVTLDKVDINALNVTGEQGELNGHTERSDGNKPAQKFEIASESYSTSENGYQASMYNVVNGNYRCNGYYSQKDDGDTKWRVPNQRELGIMFLSDPSLITDAFCRTKFSNPNYSYSWYYDALGVFRMETATKAKEKSGSVRCIKVLKK